MRHAMIMAGGSGTRLWPMSRAALPKQLLPLIGGRSLLQVAADRLDGVVPAERRLICAAERHRETVLATLPAFTDERYLGEPVGRDTVNAVAYAAAVLAATDPDAVFAVLTSDHLIEPQDVFARRLGEGFRLVEEDPRRLVTFAIEPTFAATGYGYVERGDPIDGSDEVFRAARFVEKPDRATAEEYLATGRFGWNSGMFVFAAATVLAALDRHLPESSRGVREIADAWSTPDRAATLERVYPTLPKVSVDYALMEPAASDPALQICVVPMAVQWTDVGSWPSYGETLPADDDGNRSNTRTAHLDSRNVLAISDDPTHTITTIGCHDLIIVRTADATMVLPASDAEQVKALVDHVPPTLR